VIGFLFRLNPESMARVWLLYRNQVFWLPQLRIIFFLFFQPDWSGPSAWFSMVAAISVSPSRFCRSFSLPQNGTLLMSSERCTRPFTCNICILFTFINLSLFTYLRFHFPSFAMADIGPGSNSWVQFYFSAVSRPCRIHKWIWCFL